MRRIYLQFLGVMILLLIVSCEGAQLQNPIESKEYDMSGFARGADVSWTTEMENSNMKFYNSLGQERETMQLMRELGMNSIRLRVWVDPDEGWCNKEDVLIKAYRASNLGMRIMIDFHYSDEWADPGAQNKPLSWSDYSVDELKQAIIDHTTEVLTLLKENDIEPEWVQVGNETNDGMLWDEGRASDGMQNFAAFISTGYDAVKSIFPDTKVIVHVSNAHNIDGYDWIFDGLQGNGGKWDVIGMSYYPTIIEQDTDGNSLYADGDWKIYNNEVVTNVKALIDKYSCDIMICEYGMPWEMEDESYSCLDDLVVRLSAINNCLGIFYWEPQAYAGWKGYSMGAFDSSGEPTKALEAFMQ